MKSFSPFDIGSEAPMTTGNPMENSFQMSVARANQVASRLLRLPLGAHTSEDVVSALIEKELRAGKSLPEIEQSLTGPGRYRRLANVKNDIFRWETAAKRGRGEPSASFEDVEPIFETAGDDPETELIGKEACARMKDLLAQLLEKVKLSETQLQILELDQQGYSSKQIARQLGIDIDAVYARRSEALHKLAMAARHFSRNEK
jgi:DNA-binding CsgD family transcriptional regulator